MSTATYKALVATKFTGNTADYRIIDMPRPKITKETQIEVTVHAAAVNIIDPYRAMGMLTVVLPEAPPVKFGYDVAGIVTQVGSKVKRFAVGDRVYGCLNSDEIGSVGEYVVTDEKYMAPIPADSVDYTVAASVPLAGLTAKQALDAGGAHEGQTVYVTGGMGGVGMFGTFLARHYYKAKDVITTVSTAKVEHAEKMGAATRIVDYTKDKEYAKTLENTADLVFDSIGDKSCYMVAKPGSTVSSVALIPDGNNMDKMLVESMPLSWLGWLKLAVAKQSMNVAKWRATAAFRAKNVSYVHVFGVPNGKEIEETFNPFLANGLLKPYIQDIFPFTEEGVKAAYDKCLGLHTTGKIVIRIRD
ncbi:hypothetical protein IW140_002331 [Coemansia sp. RSA 1813]|nr:hypothetical protein EV178_001994 [Coemansia sp. RSA 1646]KAJ1771804.1 hypothetical protein LPJ74_001978 [Coemansia sp. RSA 1843]KAJ2090769.1 hypothetical protein IW138_002387 [Coemansia sp. RSA 986]KAJ2216017.1 hypothetical protein EV179_001668 [Coemansia sp. RSA 487]KAJ2570431.1 hypothetical protein IW140_002331 [Coemansia sp. RSA 1813]